MKVYEIPTAKLTEWVGQYGDMYFQPIKDGNGKYVVSVNADYSELPFLSELEQCKIIDYVPNTTT